MNDYLQSKDFPEIPLQSYKIHSLIGRGAFSRVYLAYTPDYQKVAIKRLRLTQKPQALLKEISFLRKMIGKPNIVQLRYLIFSEQTLQTSFITSYLQDCVDFKQSLYNFTPLNVQRYAHSLLTALSHLEPNILHRDVKPGNFLFSIKQNRGILIDFGLAQTLAEAQNFSKQNSSRVLQSSQSVQNGLFSQSGQGASGVRLPSIVEKSSQKLALPQQPHAGTHGYRAPEILLYTQAQTCKIDVFGCGVSLLQMLLGKGQIFRDSPNYDIYELLSQRNLSGAERFVVSMGSMDADFQITSGAPQPAAYFFEKLAFDSNPGLFLQLSYHFFDLLRKLLEFSPEARISALAALRHEYFKTPQSSEIAYNNGFQLSAVQFLETQQLTQKAADLLRARMYDILDIARDDFMGGARVGVQGGQAGYAAAKAQNSILSDFYNSNFTVVPLAQNVKRGAEKLVVKFKLSPAVQSSFFGVQINRSGGKCAFADNKFTASDSRLARGQATQSALDTYYYRSEMRSLRAALTAQRRKIDSAVLLVKAMSYEALSLYKHARQLAEELRREIVRQSAQQLNCEAGSFPDMSYIKESIVIDAPQSGDGIEALKSASRKPGPGTRATSFAGQQAAFKSDTTPKRAVGDDQHSGRVQQNLQSASKQVLFQQAEMLYNTVQSKPYQCLDALTEPQADPPSGSAGNSSAHEGYSYAILPAPPIFALPIDSQMLHGKPEPPSGRSVTPVRSRPPRAPATPKTPQTATDAADLEHFGLAGHDSFENTDTARNSNAACAYETRLASEACLALPLPAPISADAFNKNIVDNIRIAVLHCCGSKTEFKKEEAFSDILNLISQSSFVQSASYVPACLTGSRASLNYNLIYLIKRAQGLAQAREETQGRIRSAQQALAFSDARFTFYSARFGDISYYKHIQDIKTVLDRLNAEIYTKQSVIKRFQEQFAMLTEDLIETQRRIYIDYYAGADERGPSYAQRRTGFKPSAKGKSFDFSDDIYEQADSLNSRLVALDEDVEASGGEYRYEPSFLRILYAPQQNSFSEQQFQDKSPKAKVFCFKNETQFDGQQFSAMVKACAGCRADSRKNEGRAPSSTPDYDLSAVQSLRCGISPAFVRFQKVRTATLLVSSCFSQFQHAVLAQILQGRYAAAAALRLTPFETAVVEKYYRSGVARKDAILAISVCQNRLDSALERPPDLAHLFHLNLFAAPRRRSQSFLPGVPKSLALRRLILGQNDSQADGKTKVQRVVEKRVRKAVGQLDLLERLGGARKAECSSSDGAEARESVMLAGEGGKQSSADWLRAANSRVLHLAQCNTHISQLGARMLQCLSRSSNQRLFSGIQRGISAFGGDVVFNIALKVVEERRRWHQY